MHPLLTYIFDIADIYSSFYSIVAQLRSIPNYKIFEIDFSNFKSGNTWRIQSFYLPWQDFSKYNIFQTQIYKTCCCGYHIRPCTPNKGFQHKFYHFIGPTNTDGRGGDVIAEEEEYVVDTAT